MVQRSRPVSGRDRVGVLAVRPWWRVGRWWCMAPLIWRDVTAGGLTSTTSASWGDAVLCGGDLERQVIPGSLRVGDHSGSVVSASMGHCLGSIACANANARGPTRRSRPFRGPNFYVVAQKAPKSGETMEAPSEREGSRHPPRD